MQSIFTATLPLARALLLTLGLGVVGAQPAKAATDLPFTAKVFDQDQKKQMLFNYVHEITPSSEGRTVTNTYKDPGGAVVAIETVEFLGKDGDKVKAYHMQQKQLGADGLVEVKDGKAKFSYSKDGKTKTAEESVGEDFIVGPTITPFLQSHWEEIQKGGHVKARLAVPDRAETVGFEYFKDHNEDFNGQKALVVKMKPSSFIIAALVKPLLFVYPQDGSRLLEVRGRTQLKQNVNGSWKDLDAVTDFEYPAAPGSVSK